MDGLTKPELTVGGDRKWAEAKSDDQLERSAGMWLTIAVSHMCVAVGSAPTWNFVMCVNEKQGQQRAVNERSLDK